MGGNSLSDVSINLNALAAKQQSIVGIPKGSIQQLQELVDALVDKKVRTILIFEINSKLKELRIKFPILSLKGGDKKKRT